ncbi:hypothetical protein GY45DRAFT_1326480 [Cubamyces sp. BRFM 1775]|nr:hypothetical protein GY45DRAFT_1326480 [Cubamyces sp. BRFM 1775]
MATRPNKKRKGRNNAPPRERTVTTLTDGPEGSFLSSQLTDDPATAAALISPHLSYPVSPPIGSYIGIGLMDPLSAAQDTYSPHSSFSAVNNYTMSSISGPAFNAQHSPPHFYPKSQSQTQPIPANSVPPQQVLPVGQNDLEILERLKETIKKNQHELFRPIPQPAALASVYLGPKPPLASLVPPHPEQIPADVSPPGLTLFSDDKVKVENGAPTAAIALNQPTSRAAQPPSAQTRDSAKLPHRSSVSESSRINTSQSPAKRTSHRHSTSVSPTKPNSLVATDPGAKHYGDANDAARAGPPGLQRLDQATISRRSPEKTGRSDTGVATVAPSQPISPELSSLSAKGDMRVSGSGWNPRSNVEGQQQRHETNSSSSRYIPQSPPTNNTVSSSITTGDDARSFPPRDQRVYERERERERDKHRDVDRERSRAREPSRSRDDRRIDERPRTADSRRLSPDTRRHEQRHPPRRYDSKVSESSFTSPRMSDKSPPGPRPYRNLGEERAIVRPPPDPSVPRPSLPDERHKLVSLPVSTDNGNARLPPATVDDRHASSPSGQDRQAKPRDDRQAPSLPLFNDQPERAEERRLPLPGRSGEGIDDRRPPSSPPLPDRKVKPADDRRDPGLLAPATLVERSARAADDNRALPPVPAERHPPPTTEVRRTQVVPPGDAVVEEHRPPLLESRISRTPVAAGQHDPTPPRPILEERATRPVQAEERSTRPVPLEERLSRAPPSLQERLSAPPVRTDDRLAPRLEDRLSRTANAPPSLEERLSNPTGPDDRSLRPADDRTSRPVTLPVERPVPRPAESRGALLEAAHLPHTVERPATRVEDRVFTPANRVTRPTTPAGSDRGHPPPPPPRSYRAPSVAPAGTRDEPPRSYRPPSPGRSPVRPDIRETRPVGEPRERERLSYKPGPDDRYVPERRPAPAPTPAQDLMEVDPVHSRVGESRLSYRRPSPPPADPYTSRDRERERLWVPAGETHREPEAGRRMAAEPPHSYTRDWREEERAYGDDWHERSWDRPHEYDRDARFVERDAAPPGWETREERERRGAYPTDVPPPPASRAYERPLSSRLTDPYPEDRAYLDRGRYPPVEPPPPPASYSRVRPRSPSPLGRRGAADDMRPPPMKRAREDPYYYPDDPPRGAPVDYPPRLRSPPPPPPPAVAYYDDPRYPPSPPGARDRDYLDRDVPGYAPYDRRADSVARMPPPPPRSPPPYARAPYGRDDRRYSMPPRA